MSQTWKVEFKNSLKLSNDYQVMELIDSYLWIVEALSLLICLHLTFMAAKKISHNEYYQSLFTFVGAMLAGMSPTLAKVFL